MSHWPKIVLALAVIALIGGIAAHRLTKPRLAAEPPEPVAAPEPAQVELVTLPGSAAEPLPSVSSERAMVGAPSDTAPKSKPGHKAKPIQLSVPARFAARPRSSLYPLFPAAGKRARSFPGGPSVRSRWYRGAGDYDRAVREQRAHNADMLVYFETEW